MRTEAKTLDELKAEKITRLKWTGVIKATSPLPEEEVTALEKYFRQFAVPSGQCLSCGSTLTGILGSFVWGIVHGEGKCSCCKYPARAYHRNIGPIEFLPAVLQYHPDELSTTEPTHD